MQHTQLIKRNQRPSQSQVDKLPIQFTEKQLDVEKLKEISSREVAKAKRKNKNICDSTEIAIKTDEVAKNVDAVICNSAEKKLVSNEI